MNPTPPAAPFGLVDEDAHLNAYKHNTLLHTHLKTLLKHFIHIIIIYVILFYFITDLFIVIAVITSVTTFAFIHLGLVNDQLWQVGGEVVNVCS